MAELEFKSAGVSTREIDLSAPTVTGPVGVPAGVIGTALEGPAFVPLTFASYGDYRLTYGASDGTRAGPIAVNEWLKNAQALTYIRVPGAGDGSKRSSSTGNVTNAGFVVSVTTLLALASVNSTLLPGTALSSKSKFFNNVICLKSD